MEFKKEVRMVKYVISSSSFETKKEAVDQLMEWFDVDTLDPEAMVYEIKKSFKPIMKIRLKDEK